MIKILPVTLKNPKPYKIKLGFKKMIYLFSAPKIVNTKK